MSSHGSQKSPLLFAEDYRYLGLLAGLCFGAAIVFRLAFLAADPPWGFTWSQALFTDGARALDGARNKILFGQWIVDMRSPVVLFYPLANLMAFVVFRLGGIGLAQANLVGALPGLASLSLVYMAMRRIEGRLAGLVALVALSFCYVHVVYSRVPMVESLLILMLLASFYLALKRNLGLFLSGLMVGLAAFMVKMHALHFVPVVIAYLIVTRKRQGEARSSLRASVVSFLGGVGVAAGVWLAFVYLVNPEVVSKYFRSNILISQRGEYADASLMSIVERRVGALIHLGSGRDGYFAKVPILTLAGFAGLLCAVSGFSPGRFSAKPWERLAAIWFAGLVVALSLLSYRPLRYVMLLSPSLALLATSFLLRLAQQPSLLAAPKPRWYSYAFGVWLGWVLIHIQQDVLFQILSGGKSMISGALTPSEMSLYRFQASVWPQVFAFGGAAALVTLLLRKRLISTKATFPRRARLIIFSVMVGGLVVHGSLRFTWDALDRKYSIIDAARSLDRVFGEGAFLVGDCSTTMSLEARFRTLPAYGDLIRYDEKQEFERYPITHFILRFPTLYEYLTKNYADFAAQAIPVSRFVLCGRDAAIVRYEGWPGYPASSYRPSGFEIAMGSLRDGRFEEACAALEGFLAGHPDSHEALLALAVCRLQMGMTEEAKLTLEKTLEITQRSPLSYEIYGDLLSSLGRNMEARIQWEKALKLNPNNRNLRTKLGSGRS